MNIDDLLDPIAPEVEEEVPNTITETPVSNTSASNSGVEMP